MFVPLYCPRRGVTCRGLRVVSRATPHAEPRRCLPRSPQRGTGPQPRPQRAAASSVCTDRCPPWGQTLGKGLAGPRGHSGTSWAPHYCTYRCSHQDHEQPPRNPADCGKLGQEIQQPPALGGPADQQQGHYQPAASPSQRPCAFPSPAGWPCRWHQRLQPPAQAPTVPAVTGSHPRPVQFIQKQDEGLQAEWERDLGGTRPLAPTLGSRSF